MEIPVSDRSKIEWTDSTFNPWIGCTKVSPACDHCYAEAMMDTRMGRAKWGPGQQRVRTSPANWRKPLQWNAKRFFECRDCGWRGDDPIPQDSGGPAECPRCESLMIDRARRRVFCASLADVFDNEVPPEWRAELFALIATTQNLDWLLLTKRIGNVARMIEAPGMQKCGLPANVWLGATICNQAEADRDIPKLLATPAAVRFLSIEPMLGPIDLRRHFFGHCPEHDFPGGFCVQRHHDGVQHLNWVIAGGESGPHARPSHPYWFRSLRDQCAAADVPFLFKQWGEWAPRAGKLFGSGTDFESLDPGCTRWPQVIRLGEHGKDTRICENGTPDMGEDVYMQRVGKKAAGRLLDGVERNGFPEVRHV